VIPTVRRYGIGTKLYQKFFELAKRRDCHWVRSLVPRDALGAIAFHRALGFEELGGEDWLANDMIVFIRSLRD
jgi:L-amino acid N-acyltransferase YncA